MTEKLTLRFCEGCSTKTIHVSRKEFNEVEYVSHIIHKCLMCGSKNKYFIKHESNRFT